MKNQAWKHLIKLGKEGPKLIILLLNKSNNEYM